jgi:hypothetical protein
MENCLLYRVATRYYGADNGLSNDLTSTQSTTFYYYAYPVAMRMLNEYKTEDRSDGLLAEYWLIPVISSNT